MLRRQPLEIALCGRELLLGSTALSLQPAHIRLGRLELLRQLPDSALRRGDARLERVHLSPQVADAAARLVRQLAPLPSLAWPWSCRFGWGRSGRFGRARRRRSARDIQARECLEARRLQLLGEPAALEQLAAVLGQGAGTKRREHAVEVGGAAPGVGEDLPRAGCKGLERVLLVAARLEERVAALGSNGLGLRTGELLAGLEQAPHVERPLPREPIDDPRR